ncbi:MAG: alpha-2-macroglobulin family protein [Paracoccaceae bacterium]
MLHRISAVVALFALLVGPSLAQDAQSLGPVPDRRIVTTTGQDFYGGDIGSIFDTDFRACRQACLGNPACQALTYNTRAEACFLKSGVERSEPFADAISAEMVATSEATRALAAKRASDLDFVPRELLVSARTLAGTLGGRFAANGTGADALISTALAAEQSSNLALAAQNYAAAVTLTDRGDLWRDLARVWLKLQGANAGETRRLRRDALSAAINGVLRSEGDGVRATALALLANVLETRGYGRQMVTALRRAQALSPRPETETRLAYAISNYGFRVTGHEVDSEAADARVCVQFSEKLTEAGLDYGPYVRTDTDTALPVTAEDRQLCLDGVERGARYKITLRQGLPSRAGEALAKSSTIEVYIRDRSPAVRFVSRANVLPKGPGAAIPVITVNLSEIELAVHRIGPRNLLPSLQANVLDQAVNQWREEQIAGRAGAAVWTGMADVSGKLNADVMMALPIGDAIETFEPGVYVMSARVPGVGDRWDRAATQWFVVTDLGLASMAGADGLHGFVRTLSSAEPVAGAKVQLLARNNEVLGAVASDATGYVQFDPGLSRGQGGMAPAMMTVAHSGDFAFLDLTAPAFDFSDRGVEGRPAPGPVDVFATTERGVYRPGEVVHLTALARDGAANAISDLPLTLVVTRPDGVEYHRALLADQGAGGRAHSVRLGAGVQRGTWSAKLHLDPKAPPVRQLKFLVEDFVPERIAVDLSAPEGLIRRGAPVFLDVATRYLYGAAGAGLTVQGEVRVTAAKEVPGFAGFQFGLEDEQVGTLAKPLLSAETNANGNTRVALALPETSALTRPLQATAVVTVQDSSGRPVERTLTRPLAPAGPQIGIRSLFDGEAPEGGQAEFEVLAIGPEGTQIGLPQVGWTLSRVHRRWQWYEVDGRWNYEPITSRERIANGEVALTANGRARIAAAVDWGRYELKLASLDGTPAAASLQFNAGWYTGGATAETPDVLEVGLDRAAYAIGDRVKVRLKPRHAGKLLLAVVDNRLIEMQTLDVDAGETSVDLTVTEAWGPGAYITATLVRPGAEDRNPARALGLAWAGVDPGPRKLDVSFATPDQVAPRGPMKTSVQLANLAPGVPAYVTIAAVDLGILNLTGFETPAPDAHYFAQRALGMEVRDLYGRLIDGHQGVIGRLRSGGDAAAARMKAPPPTEALVAFFSGVIEVGTDGTAEATFPMPDFNGTVRLMATAWTAHAVGHAEKDVLVRDPVVVSAAMPRFLAPGDEARLLVELAHASGPAGGVKLEVAGLDGGLDLGKARHDVMLGENEIRQVSIPVSASEIGDRRIRLTTATPSGESLTKDLTLGVRLLDPEVARQTRVQLSAGQSFTVDAATFSGYAPGSARATVATGALAAFDAPGLLAALDRYPYGCTEQTTSRALPLLYMTEVAEALGIAAPVESSIRIRDAIARVLENQTASGSFGLWSPGRGDLWLDAYVTDFLSRARAQGHEVPAKAFRAALDNLTSQLAYAADFDKGGEDVAFALLALAREGRASIGDLRYYVDAKAEALATPMAKAQLGAALAMYGEQVRADVMFRLAAAQAMEPETGTGWRADYGSALRDGAAVLALAAEAGSNAVDRANLTRAVAGRAGNYTSTQEKLWMLLASRAEIVSGQNIARTIRDAEITAGPVVIETSKDTDLVLTTFGVPVVPEPAGGQGYALTRRYYSLDGEPVSPSQVAQNTRLVAVLQVTPTGDRAARLMIDDPLPAGFEIDNPNLLQSGSLAALDWLKITENVAMTEFRTERFRAAVDHSGKGTVNLAYIVRAVSPGVFHHPAALVEDMYRPAFRAWTDTGRVTVVGGQ